MVLRKIIIIVTEADVIATGIEVVMIVAIAMGADGGGITIDRADTMSATVTIGTLIIVARKITGCTETTIVATIMAIIVTEAAITMTPDGIRG